MAVNGTSDQSPHQCFPEFNSSSNNSVCESGLHCWVPAKKSRLVGRNRKQAAAFVFWSDESRYENVGSSGSVFVRYRDGEWMVPACVVHMKEEVLWRFFRLHCLWFIHNSRRTYREGKAANKYSADVRTLSTLLERLRRWPPYEAGRERLNLFHNLKFVIMLCLCLL